MLSNLAGSSTFTITDVKLNVSNVFLSDNAKLSNQLSEEFKRPIYWKEYKVVSEKSYDADASIREILDSSCQGVKRLFVLANEGGANRVTVNSHRKYFLPGVEIKNYNIEIDRKNIYDDQPINDLIKQYDEVRKVSTRQSDDYAIGCLLDFAFFKKNYRLNTADLSKQKALDADSRAIEQTIFTDNVSAAVLIYYIYDKSKETTLGFYKGTTKVL